MFARAWCFRICLKTSETWTFVFGSFQENQPGLCLLQNWFQSFSAVCSKLLVRTKETMTKLFEDIARIRQRHFVVASCCRRPGSNLFVKKVDEIAATTRIRQRQKVVAAKTTTHCFPRVHELRSRVGHSNMFLRHPGRSRSSSYISCLLWVGPNLQLIYIIYKLQTT